MSVLSLCIRFKLRLAFRLKRGRGTTRREQRPRETQSRKARGGVEKTEGGLGRERDLARTWSGREIGDEMREEDQTEEDSESERRALERQVTDAGKK